MYGPPCRETMDGGCIDSDDAGASYLARPTDPFNRTQPGQHRCPLNQLARPSFRAYEAPVENGRPVIATSRTQSQRSRDAVSALKHAAKTILAEQGLRGFRNQLLAAGAAAQASGDHQPGATGGRAPVRHTWCW